MSYGIRVSSEKLIHVKIWVLFPYLPITSSIQIRWLQIWAVDIAPQHFINFSLICLGIWIFIITAHVLHVHFNFFLLVFLFFSAFMLENSFCFLLKAFIETILWVCTTQRIVLILPSTALFLVLMTRLSNRFLSNLLFHLG